MPQTKAKINKLIVNGKFVYGVCSETVEELIKSMSDELLKISGKLKLQPYIAKWIEGQMGTFGTCAIPLSLVIDIYLRLNLGLSNAKAAYSDVGGSLDVAQFISQVGLPY